jgi:tRNA threonylcarbamoyladenosine biosynthesis protein TsaE
MPKAPPSTRIEATAALADPLATDALGERIAAFLRSTGQGLNIHLCGDLGAGKTSLARAILRGLGVTGRIKSPTFALVESYVVQIPSVLDIRQNLSLYCYHFDFYRFTDPREWLDAGFREYFDGTALCLVEWPEKAAGSEHWPLPDLRITLEVVAQGRIASLQAYSPRGAACLAGAASCDPA